MAKDLFYFFPVLPTTTRKRLILESRKIDAHTDESSLPTVGKNSVEPCNSHYSTSGSQFEIVAMLPKADEGPPYRTWGPVSNV